MAINHNKGISMRIHLLNQWRMNVLAAGFLAGLLTLIPAAASLAAESEAQAEKAENRERQAQRLKAAGEGEKTRQVRREGEEMRVKGVKEQKEGDLALDERRGDLKRKLKDLQAEVKELRSAGRPDAAAKVEQQIGRLEMEIDRLAQPPGDAKRPDRPMAGSYAGVAQRDMPPLQVRLQHLQAAIENLRAAGIHPAAERLAAHAQLMKKGMGQPAGDGQGRPAVMAGEVQRLQEQIQDLRQAVRELSAKVEQLGRERR
jgi:hypothetical protein